MCNSYCPFYTTWHNLNLTSFTLTNMFMGKHVVIFLFYKCEVCVGSDLLSFDIYFRGESTDI